MSIHYKKEDSRKIERKEALYRIAHLSLLHRLDYQVKLIVDVAEVGALKADMLEQSLNDIDQTLTELRKVNASFK